MNFTGVVRFCIELRSYSELLVVVDEDKEVSAEDGARWERLFLPLGIGLPSAAQC